MAGVFNKFLGQLDGLSAVATETFGLFMSLNKQTLVRVENRRLTKILSWQPIAIQGEQQVFWQHACEALEHVNANVIYCRYDQMYSAPSMVDFYAFAKNFGAQCFLELPTYPYAQEIQDNVKRQVDETNRLALAPHTDLIFSTSRFEKVMGVENIFFTNQVNKNVFELASQSTAPLIDLTNKLSILSVANVREWHGFDRAIVGLANYNKASPEMLIHYHIVGEGNHLGELKTLVGSLNLSEYVTFHGHKSAQQLTEFYDHASLCIASLGLHRIGIEHSSTLKVREYLANGLPLVACNPDPALVDLPWVYWCKEDDSALNFTEIVEFVKQQNSQYALRQDIRQYAHKHLTWQQHAETILEHAKQLLNQCIGISK
jgi:glycosyltransferase involved in cell wall biosynthesis